MPLEDEGLELMAFLPNHHEDTDSSGANSCDEPEFIEVVVDPGSSHETGELQPNNAELEPTTAKKLFDAIKENDVDEVKRVLLQGDITVNTSLGTNHFTSFHLAVLRGNVEVLQALLEHDTNADHVDKYGRSPLHLAVCFGHVGCVTLLVERCPALVQRKVKKSKDRGTLKRIYSTILDTDIPEEIPQPTDDLTPLHLASQKADIECVRQLLAAGANVNALDDHKLTPLDVVGERIPRDKYETASDSFLQVIQALIAEGGAPTTETDAKYRETPMHIAVSLKCVAAIPVLANAGYNTPLKNKSGNTALHAAVRQRSEDQETCPLMKLELVYGQVGLESKNKEGETPLHIAVQQQWLLAVKTLLECGADITAKTNKKKTVLHLASQNHVIMNELLEHSQSHQIVNEVDSTGNTPLFLSIHAKHFKCVSLLLSNKADLTKLDGKKRSVLHCAIENKHTKILEELFKHDETSMIKMKDTPINEKGLTAIQIAVIKSYSKGTQILVDHKCDLRAEAMYEKRSLPPLHLAAMKGHEDIVKILLKADPLLVDVVDSQGMLPIHWACIHRHTKIVTMLVDAGSDLSTKCTYPDRLETTAMDLLIHRVPSSVDLLNKSMDSSFKMKKEYIEINYKILLPQEISDDSKSKKSNIQMKVMDALVQTGDQVNQQSLFMHPLIESFLHLQWKRISKFYYALIFSYMLFVVPFSILVVIIFHSEENEMSENPSLWVNVLLRIVIFISSLIHIPHELLYMYYKTCNSRYFLQWEFSTKVISFIVTSTLSSVKLVFALIIILITVIDPTNSNLFPRELATGAILLFWVEFMWLVSRVPTYGFYMLMFFEVTANFFVVLFSFTFLIVGFMITFFIEFQAKSPFHTKSESLVKTVVMMTDEFEYKDLFENFHGSMAALVFTKIVFLLFVLLVGIVIMNILLAKAISDVKKVDRLRKQAQFLSTYEQFFVLLCLKNEPVGKKLQIQFDKDKQFPQKLMHTILDKAFKVSKATKEQYKETQTQNGWKKDVLHNDCLLEGKSLQESSLGQQNDHHLVEINKKIDLLTKMVKGKSSEESSLGQQNDHHLVEINKKIDLLINLSKSQCQNVVDLLTMKTKSRNQV